MSIANEIKNSGLKATGPRMKILEVFQNAQERHMSAEDVYRILIQQGSDIGLATVYRVLSQFEQAGLAAALGAAALPIFDEFNPQFQVLMKAVNTNALFGKAKSIKYFVI